MSGRAFVLYKRDVVVVVDDDDDGVLCSKWRGYNCVIVQWHSLSREEQAKYYEKARQERQLHMQLYPGWSARDNYGYGTKKKKRKKERTPVESGGIRAP